MTTIQEMVVDYDPSALTATVARRRKLVIGRIISLAITVVVMVVFYVWQRAAFSTAVYVLYGVALALTLGFLLFRFLSFRQAAKDLATAGHGTAIRIGRGGVQVGEVGAPWPEVTGLAVVRRGIGREQALQLSTASGRTGSVPLDQVVVYPSALDSAARAYSAGRHGVDLSALDT